MPWSFPASPCAAGWGPASGTPRERHPPQPATPWFTPADGGEIGIGYFLREGYNIKPKGYSRHRPISLIKSRKTPSSVWASDQSSRHNVPAEAFAEHVWRCRGLCFPHTSFPEHKKLRLKSPGPRRERWFLSDGNDEYIMKSFNSSH